MSVDELLADDLVTESAGKAIGLPNLVGLFQVDKYPGALFALGRLYDNALMFFQKCLRLQFVFQRCLCWYIESFTL